jgi:WD40 repeat protein
VPKQQGRGGQWRLVPSQDGQWLALLSHQIVTIWRTDTGNLARPDGYPTVAGDVAFTAAGQLLIFDFGDYGRFRTWDLSSHQETNKVLLSGKPTSGVDEGRYSFDRTAQRMAFAGYNELGCFDTRTGAALWLRSREGGVKIPTTLSADGTRLVVGGGTDFPKAVRLYDAITGERLRQFDFLAGQVLALAISSNGQRLVTATAADGLQLWDCATGKTLQTYAWQVPGWNMGPPVFSADGQWLAAVGSSFAIGAHEIGIFNTVTGRLKWVIRFQTDSSFGADMPLAFSPDGTFLYIATDRIEAWLLK